MALELEEVLKFISGATADEIDSMDDVRDARVDELVDDAKNTIDKLTAEDE